MSAADPYAKIAEVLEADEGARRIRSYAALGDSFTAGTGTAPGERWADRLAARLGAGNPDFVYRNLAVKGATSAEVLDQLGPALQLEPDLVTVVCGANDVLLSVRPDPAAYARRLAGVFRRLREALPAVRIATATAPESWDFLELGPRTRARVERGIARFNAATRALAEAHDVPCLEVAGHPGLGVAENFVADGLHPSPRGHRQAAVAFCRLLGLEPATEQEEEEEEQR
jgi:lysophospholipase L1-like esterase